MLPVPNLGKTLMWGHRTNFNCFPPPHGVVPIKYCQALPESLNPVPWTVRHGPRSIAPAPRDTLPRPHDGLLFGVLQQPVADQQRDATLAYLDRCDHDHAPGAARSEASCTGGGCWFDVHVTDCYYDINGELYPTLGYAFGLSIWSELCPRGNAYNDFSGAESG